MRVAEDRAQLLEARARDRVAPTTLDVSSTCSSSSSSSSSTQQHERQHEQHSTSSSTSIIVTCRSTLGLCRMHRSRCTAACEPCVRSNSSSRDPHVNCGSRDPYVPRVVHVAQRERVVVALKEDRDLRRAVHLRGCDALPDAREHQVRSAASGKRKSARRGAGSGANEDKEVSKTESKEGSKH